MLDKDARDEINEMIDDKIRRVNSRIYEIEVKQTVLENTISGKRLKPGNYQIKPDQYGRPTINKVSSGWLGPLIIILLALVITLIIVFLKTHNVTIFFDGQRIDILPS